MPPTTKTTRVKRKRPLEKLTINQVVARQIGALRSKMGLSQQDLANEIGESQSTIARIESGKRSITIEELLAIAVGLNVAPVELLTGSFEPTDVPVASGRRLRPRDAHEWVRGERPLPGFDEVQYWTNASAERAKARITFPGLYALQMYVNDLERALIEDEEVLADQALAALEHTREVAQRFLEQRASAAFWAARARRRGEAGDA